MDNLVFVSSVLMFVILCACAEPAALVLSILPTDATVLDTLPAPNGNWPVSDETRLLLAWCLFSCGRSCERTSWRFYLCVEIQGTGVKMEAVDPSECR